MGRMGHVIKDGTGKFVNHPFVLTDEGWCYCSYTGRTDGFIFFTIEKRAQELVDMLEKANDKYGFHKEFHIEKIDDVFTIPKGEFLIEEITPDNEALTKKLIAKNLKRIARGRW